MNTPILAIASASTRRALHLALQNHAIIIAPTDTVYGIMCRFDSPSAVQRLFEIKRRSPQKAIPVLIGGTDQLSKVVKTPLTPIAAALAESFWPGPLTLILPALPGLPRALTAGGATVGVRMPDHDALREIMRDVGPLAATSANTSGRTEARSAQEALEQLGDTVSLAVSDDEAQIARHRQPASTVVDLSGKEVVILRKGPIADEVLDYVARRRPPSC
jgi:L-threonylcarbamoyladenylate synthase